MARRRSRSRRRRRRSSRRSWLKTVVGAGLAGVIVFEVLLGGDAGTPPAVTPLSVGTTPASGAPEPGAAAREAPRPAVAPISERERAMASALAQADAALATAGQTSDLAQQTAQLLRARQTYQELLEGPLPLGRRARWMSRLDLCNASLIFSPRKVPQTIAYQVRFGDNLGDIGQAHGQGIGLICQINADQGLMGPDGPRPGALRAGAVLKLLDAPVRITIDLSEFTLSVYSGSQMLKQYFVGIGREGSTPRDTFTVRTKLTNPRWRGVPFGDPRNPLGTRWLGFAERPAYGIHGCRTSEENLIPGPCSKGCVRLVNRDAEEVFGFTPRGTVVTITP